MSEPSQPSRTFENRLNDSWYKEFEPNSVYSHDFVRTPSRGPSPLKIENDITEEEGPAENIDWVFTNFKTKL